MQGFKKVLVALLVVMTILGTMGPVFAATPSSAGVTLQALGLVKGDDKGDLLEDQPLERAQAAALIVRALGQDKLAQQMAGATKFADVNSAPGLQWATGYINLAVEQGIVTGYPNGQFGGYDKVEYAQFIAMVLRALGYNEETLSGTWPTKYLVKAHELDITDGVTISSANAPAVRGDVFKILENALTVPKLVKVGYGTDTKYVVSGTEDTEEKTLMMDLGYDKVEGILREVPRLVGSTLDDDEVKIDNDTYAVAADLDVEALFGLDVEAYVNDDDEIVIIDAADDVEVFFDAIEYDGDELKLVGADKEYDLAEDVVVYVDGEEADLDELLEGAEDGLLAYDYAKVVLNDDGDVRFIDAYTWDGFIVVEKVEDDVVYGYGDELDVEDYTVVKDGKVAEPQPGDILFYNEDAEFAEIYVNKVEGTLERVFDVDDGVGSFKLDGEEYEYIDGEALYLDGDEVEFLTSDVLDSMMDEGGEVVVYLDRAGYAVYVEGDTGEEDTDSFYAYVTENTSRYSVRTKYYYNLDVLNEMGEEVQYDIAEDDLSDVGYDNSSNWLADIQRGAIVKIEVEEDEDVASVVYYAPNAIGDEALEADEEYYNGYKILKSAVVFITEDVDADDFDADDIEVTTYGDVDFDITEGYYYVNDEDEIVAIVAEETDREGDTTVYSAVAVANAKKVVGEDVYKVVLNIGGEEGTYYTAEDIATEAGGIAEGDLLTVTIDDKTGEVVDVEAAPSATIAVSARSVTNKTITGGDVTYYVEDAVILDATDDYKVISLRDIAAGDTVDLLLAGAGSKRVKFVVRTAKPE